MELLDESGEPAFHVRQTRFWACCSWWDGMAHFVGCRFYWLTVVTVRAAGTAVGDLVSGRNMLGLPLSTLVTGLLFVALLLIWKERRGSDPVTQVN
jgi:Repeat of Unknown Function (DUF347)